MFYVIGTPWEDSNCSFSSFSHSFTFAIVNDTNEVEILQPHNIAGALNNLGIVLYNIPVFSTVIS